MRYLNNHSFGSKVDSLWRQGRRMEARKLSYQARNCSILGIVIGVVEVGLAAMVVVLFSVHSAGNHNI